MSREMKDSGINAIGKTPASWKITKIKNIASLQTGDSIRASDKNKYTNSNKNAYPYIATKDISLSSNMIDYNNGIFIPADNNTFKIAKENSILLCIEGGSAGKKIGFTNQSVSFVNKLCNLYSNTMNNKFLFYYFLSPAFTNQFNMNITGLIGGVSLTKLKGISISLPLQNEQQRIVNYLDKKTSEINSIVEKTKESIEELKAYKQSLITEVVTKGLNPDAPMKDSGIEWIGKIPENWPAIRVKNVFKLNGRIGWQGLTSREYIDEGPHLVTGTDFEAGRINWDTTVRISEERYEEAPEIHLKENDLLITKDGTIGKVALTRNTPDKASLNSGVLLMREKHREKINKKFMYYVLLSNVFWDWYYMSDSGGSTIKHLYQNQFYNFYFPLPKLIYQNEIISFLDDRTQEVDNVISKKEELIKELESYKQSLIYEYVTGKKEVE